MIKKIFLSLTISLLVVFSLSLYLVSQLDIEQVIVCSNSNDTNLFLKPSCNFYFNNFTTHKDIIALDQNAGIAFAFGLEPPSRTNILERLISLGADINKPSSIDGLTPLNSAILMNDPQLVNYLLAHGANVQGQNLSDGKNSIEFLKLLIAKNSDLNREALLKLLSPIK